MSEEASGGKSRWVIAAAGAIAVVSALMFLFRPPMLSLALPAQSSPAPVRSAVKMAKRDEGDLLLKQETELRDLRPLFLPTERNAALPDPRLEPGRTLLDNENLKLPLADADVQVSRDLPPVITLNGKPVEMALPVDALGSDGEGIALLGFGRGKVKIDPFPTRGGFVEVTASRDGKQVLALELPPRARPPGDRSWAPLEMIAVVDAAGLASPLVVTEGSRVEEVDAHFRNFLTQTFRIGDRLEPGFYRISVAP